MCLLNLQQRRGSNPTLPITTRNNRNVKAKLRNLGTRFVFVPADKAANNVVVVRVS